MARDRLTDLFEALARAGYIVPGKPQGDFRAIVKDWLDIETFGAVHMSKSEPVETIWKTG